MSNNDDREEIAIVGMAGRFPGASNIFEFWKNLCDGVESIRAFTDAELAASGVTDAMQADPNFVNAGAVMDKASEFDAAFFGMSNREAELTDPQHRVFLECAWEAMEHAGYNPRSYSGPVGVFGGVATNTYFQQNLLSDPELPQQTGNYPLLIASEREYAITRVAFKLGLRGPAVSVNTACSTSAVAVHLACQSLFSGESDLALAGGARIRVPMTAGYIYQEDGILSPDGHCRTFDENARGTVAASGAAIVVLKRLSDALNDGDTVYALVKGTAINNDGSEKAGFTAPSIQGQLEVIQEALAVAEVNAGSIEMVEAHGTGTSIGDPIEVAALTQAFRRDTSDRQYCAIGSLKTNIGHLDAAAGVAGIIKAALSLYYRKIPPSLNFVKPNPQIDFESSPFFVNTELKAWENSGEVRRAGVSSFGLGGTNAHVILEEAPVETHSRIENRLEILTVSARSPAAVEKSCTKLADYLENHRPELADVSFTLQTGRHEFEYRHTVIADSIDEAVKAFRELKANTAAETSFENPEFAFLFPGGGSQHIGMAARLYETEPVFRDAFSRCAKSLAEQTDLDLLDLVYPPSNSEVAEERLRQVSNALPVLFSLEYSLAQCWIAWGVRPSYMLGHSLGEYVAATISGVFTLDTGLGIVAERARIMESAQDGAMLNVALSSDEITPYLNDQVSLAVINSSENSVISGISGAIKSLEERLVGDGVDARIIPITVASHSLLMEPVLEQFRDYLQSVEMNAPKIPFVSNVSGQWITEEQATDPEYWTTHLRSTVKFADGVNTILATGADVLIEVGPGQTLTSIVRQSSGASSTQIFSSLPHPKLAVADDRFFFTCIGNLWKAGTRIKWRSPDAQVWGRRTALPAYPFEHRHYWIDPLQQKIANNPNAIKPTAASPPVTQLAANATINAKPDLQNVTEVPQVSVPNTDRKDRIQNEIIDILVALSGLERSDIDPSATFLELGFDSLFLTQANSKFTNAFGVRITFRILFEQAQTISALTSYLDEHMDPDPEPVQTLQEQNGAPNVNPHADSDVDPEVSISPELAMPGIQYSDASGDFRERIINRQLEIMREQLKLLGGAPSSINQPTSAIPRATKTVALEKGKSAVVTACAGKIKEPGNEQPITEGFDPWKPAATGEVSDLPHRQQQHIDKSIARFHERTCKSKEWTQAHRADSFALTEGQEEIWLSTQISDDASRALNISSAIRFHGELDVAALESAIAELIVRHESLRTTISSDPECQTVASTLSLELPCTDLTDKDSKRCDELIQATKVAHASEVFDLEKGPLIRFRLVSIKHNEHLLLITAHHVVCDGWSLGVLNRDLSILYSQIKGESERALPPANQYSEFAAWNNAERYGKAGKAAEIYWMDSLTRTKPPRLILPTDYPAAEYKTFASARSSATIDTAMLSSLRSMTTQHGVTFFSILLSAYQLLLSRLSGERDMIIGVFAAGQTLSEMPEIIGHCVSVLPVRINLDDDQLVSERLKSCSQLLWDAYDHQILTFGALAKKMRQSGNNQFIPSLATTITLETETSGIDFHGLEATLEKMPKNFGTFDLELYLTESDEEMVVDFQYNSDLFSSKTIGSWLQCYLTILRSLAAEPSQRVSDLKLLDDNQLNHFLNRWNNTHVEVSDHLVHELFEDQAARLPEKIALSAQEESVTYKQLNEKANQLARYLKSLGVDSQTLVGVCVDRSVNLIVSLLAVNKVGGAYVPLDPHFPEERIAFMLEDSDLRFLLTQTHYEATFTNANINLICVDNDWSMISEQDTDNLDRVADATHLAYLIYTSGSTGKPKAVQVPNGAVSNFLHAMRNKPGITEDDVVLAITTISFDIAVTELWLPLAVGARIELTGHDESSDGIELRNRIEKSGITFLQATPATFQILLDAGWKGSSKLKILCGGEALSSQLAYSLITCGTSVWNMYGPTETTVWSSCIEIDADNASSVPIGPPIDNTQFYVVDAQHRFVPVGVPGELWIGGQGVACGYLNRPALTAERFIDNPFSDKDKDPLYRTGDLVKYANNGAITFLGRIDNQLKIRGYRIELGEIESTLKLHPSVKDAVVVGREDEPGNKRLVSYVVTKDNSSSNTSELRAFLGTYLPDYMIPGIYVDLSELPLTPNLKVDRKKLPQPSDARPEQHDRFIKPSTEKERALAEIWQDTLGISEIGVNDNFFDLGGDSLLAVRLVNKIEKRIGIKVPWLFLMQGATIAELAKTPDKDRLLDQTKRACVPLIDGGSLTPLFLIGSSPQYLHAVRHLHPEQSAYRLDAYALQDWNLKKNKRLLRSIESIASSFIHDIKNVQPVGPYLIGGGCEGSLIAYEMANQLSQKGEKVDLLMTWGTPAPGPDLGSSFAGSPLRRTWWQFQSLLSKGSLKNLGWKGYWDLIRHEFIEHSLFSAMMKYNPSDHYDGDLELIILEENVEKNAKKDKLGWSTVINGEVRVSILPGNHDTWLTNHVDSFGNFLESCLAERRSA